MIEYVTIDQAAELDAFVLRQPNCHFMQTSAWGRVKEGWGWTGILCRDEKGEIIGSMAILEHRIRHMHTGFLYAPRGPIFRDGDYATLEALVDAMRALAEKRGDYMIRIDPMLEETDTAFLDEVRAQNGVELFPLTIENREEAPAAIAAWYARASREKRA